MLYLDTSSLAPLSKTEERSADVRRFMHGLTSRLPTISHWTRVEFSSLVAKDVRIGLLTQVQADAVDDAFDTFSRQTCTVLNVAHGDFDLAKRSLSDRRSGLRAGDALHLAIAANAGAVAIYSLDKVMVAAGRTLGLPTNVGFPVAPD